MKEMHIIKYSNLVDYLFYLNVTISFGNEELKSAVYFILVNILIIKLFSTYYDVSQLYKYANQNKTNL